MGRKVFTRGKFTHVNGRMTREWTRALSTHFGDEIVIGQPEDLPAGQLWLVDADTCIGDNTAIERNILAFTFTSHEYENAALDTKRFYRINDEVYDEIATLLCESEIFYPIRKILAAEVYADGDSDMVLYSMTIWAVFKDNRGNLGLSDGVMSFSVNSPNPEHYQIDGIGHGSPAGHFTYVPSAFLSHTALDKPRVRDVQIELRNAGITTWIDQAELKAGDSLAQKIGDAIEHADTLVAFLSKTSIRSRWVQKELNVAGTFEISGDRLTLVPVLLDDVPLPPMLADKLFVDLRDPKKKLQELAKLVRATDARFWRMRDRLTYKQAEAVAGGLSQWRLPTIEQAERARTAMIYGGTEDYNAPFWTSSWADSKTSFMLEGISHRRVGPSERRKKFYCVLVPS